MYAVGGVFYHIAESGHIYSVYRKSLLNIAETCRVVEYLQRLTVKLCYKCKLLF